MTPAGLSLQVQAKAFAEAEHTKNLIKGVFLFVSNNKAIVFRCVCETALQFGSAGLGRAAENWENFK